MSRYVAKWMDKKVKATYNLEQREYYFHLLKLEIYALLNHITTSWHILTAPYGNNIHFQVLHHMLSLISVVFAMYSGEGQLYTYMCLISETTTPGINLRWYLMKWMCTVFFNHLITSMYLTCSVIKVPWYRWNEKIQGLSCQWCYDVCCMAGMLLQCKLWRTHYLLFVIEYSNML
jgi:hypothetical protein